jgi:hypothetical protein
MALELVGKKFGRLTVQSRSSVKSNSKSIRWNCQCECGSKVTITGSNLISSNTTSCGCLHRERVIETFTTHDMSYTKTYMTWAVMVQRCTNKNSSNYKSYGAKGIKVCDRWLHSFENFLEDMGQKPPGKSVLKRIQTDGDYQKSNCKWIIYNESSNGVHI